MQRYEEAWTKAKKVCACLTYIGKKCIFVAEITLNIINYEKKSILAALLLIVAGVQTTRAQKMTVNLANGKTVVYRVSQVESVTFDETASDYDFVDLGLPSGTLWATCNVGANSPEEVGDYFAWGETEPKSNYTEDNYTFSIGEATQLPEKNDAATINWGSKWRMPSYDQIKELCQNTTAEWTTLNSASVLKVTSKTNGNSIFLPTTGSWGNGSIYLSATSVEYWSRTRSEYDDDCANELLMRNVNYNNDWSSAYNYSSYFYRGQTVRAVRK